MHSTAAQFAASSNVSLTVASALHTSARSTAPHLSIVLDAVANSAPVMLEICQDRQQRRLLALSVPSLSPTL